MLLLLGLGLLSVVAALGEKRVIAFQEDRSAQRVFSHNFVIANQHYATPLVVDPEEDIAVLLAVKSFANDVWRVTGVKPEVHNSSVGGEAIVVRTDPAMDAWESFDVRVEDRPMDGRGAIYALYTLTEQFGVSPFHFWADVPVKKQKGLEYVTGEVLSHGEPTVKYRGLFINDEHPAMYTWAAQRWRKRWGEPVFLPDMYEAWFDMMLRLKANYFWPASESPWTTALTPVYASMFDVDGLNVTHGLPKEPTPGPNQVLAHNMGIVMGTSHHEPMARNKPEWDREGSGPWDWTNDEKLIDWWTYGAERAKGKETMFTLGMRGDGDMPLTGASNQLQDILRTTNGDVPQMWCMYKEVAEYYIHGLKVPEDVITLFADDNWGNVMTVQPPGKEHKAGSGIYYHVDYVAWEQMTIAAAFNTTSIWILNVGTLKPLELPVEHFMSLAWDINAWPVNSVSHFLELWAEREFHSDSKEIADIMFKYSMYASRRKAELVNSTTWAERVLEEWQGITLRAEKVYHSLDAVTKPAFYQQVYLLCLLQTNLNQLYISAHRSNLYAEQGRNAANLFAKNATDAFYHDAELTETFHSMLGRKWDHMLDQANSPAREGIPIPELGYGVISNLRVTFENSKGSWPGNTAYNCARGEHCDTPELMPMDPWGRDRWVDVGAAGPETTSWKVESDPWIIVSPRSGRIIKDGSQDQRLRVSIDWANAPSSGKGTFHLTASDGSEVTILVPVSKPHLDQGFTGHVQGDGYVAIEAGHWSRNTPAHGYSFEEMHGYGRTLSGVEMFPRTTQNFTLDGPRLEYTFWTHGGNASINVQIGPALNFLGTNKTLAFAFQVDDQTPEITNPIPTQPLGFASDRPENKPVAIGAVPKDWIEIVKNEIRDVPFSAELTPGEHTITLYGMTTGIVFERILIDLGGVSSRGYSYLGPPESKYV
ncbi:hypothetical protein IAU60_004909 [Kwoniella sp. DSM 27419]